MGQPNVVSLWRYPVKSMMGEELNATDITEEGLVGDRKYALIDTSTGKLANAKNPIKWPNMFDYRAAYVEPPQDPAKLPAVRITFPDGSWGVTTDGDLDQRLTKHLDRPVKVATISSEAGDVQFEGYIPDIEGLNNRKSVFTRSSPEGTFYDIDIVHLLTTASINKMRELIPESRIEVRRFRTNIVIDVPNEEGFVENGWVGKQIRIGDEVLLQVTQPCIRCIMTTLAQGDLPNDPAILRTAVKHNKGAMGVYAKVIQTGRIRRGDKIVIE
ncbi:MOSC domain-containing protein [Paenibacillus filicis]|uniref:MOSC domain-containing protein n=1 Tax=Paenibacillus gyeongsangnamensis TaxID=3388067 RepID=A0ABT4QAD7_9BACL|nr:MOSC domain-containing protein [Paenibacillus filicis]MCZ8513859.1 MOSC domain-containing protein [Paenibacillus filicis]